MSFSSLTLTIDSVATPASEICEYIRIDRRENEAATMEVTLLPGTGSQDITDWAGKSISLVVDTVTAYTGVIDYPQVNVIGKRIILICTDKRREIINNQTISSVGYYSSHIFQDVDEVADELAQRLQTIPSAADIKPDGTYAVTSMLPKATADFTLTDSDVYRRNPTVSPTSRARLINQVNLSFKYRYTRLRHRERSFQIGDNTFCEYSLAGDGVFTYKKQFMDYIAGMTWQLKPDSVVFEELPPSSISYSQCAGDPFIWNKPNDLYALWVEFDAAYRFAQTITEDYTLTVKAPQSITQYGTIEQDLSHGCETVYDAAEFEKNDAYKTPTGFTTSADDSYDDQDDSTEFNNAVETAINIAATTILKSHRDTQVTFETDLRLDFDLTKTIYLNSTPLQAKGKVTALNHSLDITNKFTTTTTEISLSTAQGTQTADTLTAPTRPTVSLDADTYTSTILIELTTAGVGDITSPAIDATSRDEQTETASQTYNLEIQNDTFGITF
jgi:hypothetical protein